MLLYWCEEGFFLKIIPRSCRVGIWEFRTESHISLGGSAFYIKYSYDAYVLCISLIAGVLEFNCFSVQVGSSGPGKLA